jgi:hypothetical protein
MLAAPRWFSELCRLVWLAYAGWEAYVTQWRSSSGDMAIRVEMLLLGPVLLVALIVGLATAVFRYKRAVSKTASYVAAVPGRRVSRESRTVPLLAQLRCRLTPPSSGQATAGCACFRSPHMSNVRCLKI